jgi:hypothetical protein
MIAGGSKIEKRHCERSEAIPWSKLILGDCFAVAFLTMTVFGGLAGIPQFTCFQPDIWTVTIPPIRP